MKDKIIQLFKEYEAEIDNFNAGVFKEDYDELIDKILNLFAALKSQNAASERQSEGCNIEDWLPKEGLTEEEIEIEAKKLFDWSDTWIEGDITLSDCRRLIYYFTCKYLKN
jgi:hypothetical protein